MLETLQFWLWLVLVFITLSSFIFFSVYYSVRWKWNIQRRENLNPFLVAQLTTAGDKTYKQNKPKLLSVTVIVIIGDYQTTEYAEDGIIVPKLFYKSSSNQDRTEAVKDKTTELTDTELKLIQEKIKSNDECIDVEELSCDLEILQESSVNKIITEMILQPEVSSEGPREVTNRRMLNDPIKEDPERPLEAMYQPSVPVVQVEDNVLWTTSITRSIYRSGKGVTDQGNLRGSFTLLDLLIYNGVLNEWLKYT